MRQWVIAPVSEWTSVKSVNEWVSEWVSESDEWVSAWVSEWNLGAVGG